MEFTESTWYKVTIFTLIMPCNGIIFANTSVWLGSLLILGQVPWFLDKVCGVSVGAYLKKIFK